MLKRLLAIAAVFIFFAAAAPAFAGHGQLVNAQTAINDALSNAGFYYQQHNQNGDNLNYVSIPILSNYRKGNDYYGCLVYGSPQDVPGNDLKDSQYRYLGFTINREDYTNVAFPPDVGHTGYFEDQDWIIRPWLDDGVKANYTVYDNGGLDGSDRYALNIRQGILIYYTDSSNANNYQVKGVISETQDFWDNIQDFIHVLAPPTDLAWGIGRMWRHGEDGQINYVTVPLLPGELVEPELPAEDNLKAVSINLGVPSGNKANPGTKYQARVVFENQSAKSFTEVPVAVLHGVYHAVLYDESGRLLPKKVVSGKEVQVADFQPGQSRTFRCDWHPWPQATDGLTGIINRDEIGKVYLEITYEDNVVSAEVPVDFQNLRVEIIDHPAEVIEGDTATVAARVFNESRQMVVTKVVWKVDGRVAKEVNNFDVISEADTVLNFTMPDHDVSVEIEVNPARNAPPNESTHDDNSASRTVRYIPEKVEASGRLTIDAPNPVYAKHVTKLNDFYEDVGYDIPEDWNFTVTVITNISKPKTDPDDPPPSRPAIKVNVGGQSQRAWGYHHEGYNLYGSIVNDNVQDVSYSDSASYTAGWGRYEKTLTFTFPKSGLYGYDKTVNLSATADCKKYGIHLSASKNVTIKGLFTSDGSVKLTQ